MRDRHIPRLCPICQAPMARQQDSCWACGAVWPAHSRTPIDREAAERRSRGSADERWANEGGNVQMERRRGPARNASGLAASR